MIRLDKFEFDKKCTEVINDVKEQEMRSSAWGWMAIGALAGLAASCFRVHKKQEKPIIGSFRKPEGERHGFTNSQRDM